MFAEILTLTTKNSPFLLQGFAVTLELTFWTVVGGILLGTPLAIARCSNFALVRYPATVVIEALRGTPSLMLVFWFYFLLPRLVGSIPAFTAGLVALIAFNASYTAEIVRAGIQAVDRGLIEAGRSSGLSSTQIMRLIILPQAFSNMTPALVSQIVMVYKTTSIVFIIGVVDIFRAATIINNREFQPFEIFLFVGLVYLVPSTLVSRFSRWLETRRLHRRGNVVQAG